MNKSLCILFCALEAGSARAAAPAAALAVATAPPASPAASDSDARADQRFNEMLDRMRSSVEEIAALYGNPTFLQVFTNDPGRADELKQRLRTDHSAVAIATELRSLERKREDLLGDIALKQREAARLAGRLIRQRAALDALAAAVDAARKTIEDSSR